MDIAYTRREYLADAAVHAVGVPAGILGALWIMREAVMRGDGRMTGALALYALGLVLMLSLSAAYNLVTDAAWKQRLRIWDHAAIFIMIAGTYSPLALIALHAADGVRLFEVVWIAALTGAALKLCYPGRFERLSTVVYVALGWTFVWMWKPMAAAIPLPGLELLVTGGVLYTAGVGVHLAHRLRYHNALWHALVLAAAGCHYVAILEYVVRPALVGG